ncbi:MAG: hypothetical protein RR397_02245 [Odoribacter sp.]
MENQKEILKRYYRGETTLQEEQSLREARRRGELPEEAVLDFRGTEAGLPESLTTSIRHRIRKSERRRIVYRWIAGGSVAAVFVLIISLRGLLPVAEDEGLSVSDHLKKERFENALQVIGNVLEGRIARPQKVLYEDHHLIIAIE